MSQPLLLSAGCIPTLVLIAAVFIDRWQRKRRGERQPLSEKLLRPAGYSLQRKLEDLNDSFMVWLMSAFLFSLLVAIFPQTRATDVMAPILSLIIFGLIAAVCCVVALRKLYQIRDYRRGLLGEQAMAEELQALLAHGYQVFHDVPGSDKWNIDHVAVGPAGVFAIETKYRTKKPGEANKRDNEAVFDGYKIQYPSGFDAEAHQQAERNARWLAKELTKAVAERVAVQPIVALPGWWVTLKVNSDVKVLSGKQVASYIAKEPPRLTDKLIQQIKYQLEQRCRDVEF